MAEMHLRFHALSGVIFLTSWWAEAMIWDVLSRVAARARTLREISLPLFGKWAY
jgi:hypothetical protein